ncbi:hypothetical protein BTA35_0211005 [Oceanospirillum linum]|uniref:C-type lysozyme inhibitor domain-containing protein n=1 Tax=Oceanospirillum linum TaxID=966 RepID=A0A1T1HAP4_OCELI|nr:hypothetical protein BTA35_0211005 [Oceanospirillum linum]SEG21511.1 putative lipoprotein [Oleiphilus messinensis]SMP25050.1 putative lipoprotein [Oceanospirillum linum]
MVLNGLPARLRWLGLWLVFLLVSGCSVAPPNPPETGPVTPEQPLPEDRSSESAPNTEQESAQEVLPAGVISGQVSYRERIALLPGAFVRVVLIREAVKAEPPVEIAEQIFHPLGQVPFTYHLKFKPEDIRSGFRYVVKGQIFSGDERLLFASKSPVVIEPLGPDREIDLLLMRVPVTQQSHMKPMTAAVSRVFQCGDFAFGTRTGIGEIALYLPDGVLVLSQVRSASGARYEEGDTLFWMKGDRAMLSYKGTLHSQCVHNADRDARDPHERRPVDFRAVGQEPPWLLEVVSQHNLNLITEYGQKRVQLPEPKVIYRPDSVTYRAMNGADRVSATVRSGACQDSMADKIWPQRVSVWWNGRHYQGCGEFLQP